MKILWVSNSPIGPAASILDEEYKGSSGGWIQSEYEFLDKKDISMSFLCFAPSGTSEEIIIKENDIGKLYAVKSPMIQNGHYPSDSLIKKVKKVIDEVAPDLIQIWGTETCISNAASQCAPNIPKVLFIQGLLGVHKRYLDGYFTKKNHRDVFRGLSLEGKIRSWLRNKLFVKQADIEADTIKNCKNVIIDSEFAEAYCRSLSLGINCYYHVLLPNAVFDQYRWDFEKAEKHQIFTVYGGSAEKGLQQLLLAIGLLKCKYPDICVCVPGNYPLNCDGKLSPSKRNNFETVLLNLLKQLDIEDNVKFTGRLSPSEMAEAISSSHIFVNPSCMEVHALSLREAMKMGVPCITSLCGSTGCYVKNGENGYIYRYEEYELLALYIDRLFADEELCRFFSKNSLNALEQYQKDKNKALREIYELILEKN